MKLPANRTKIVATIGPASQSVEVMRRMLLAGMNVARLNFSHGDFEGHRRVIENLREASAETRRRVAILADLSGPKLRIGDFASEPVELRPGDGFTLTTKPVAGDAGRVSVSFRELPHVVRRGDALYLNDGYVQLEVEDVNGPDVVCRVVAGGELRSRKGLNLPGIALGMGAFTTRDREALEFALGCGVEMISQSFVESAQDIEDVRAAARELGHAPFVIAKIERSRALERLEEILAAADGVMIARGDLGVEVPIEKIALVQKDIVQRASRLAKPVITATQMLESMTSHRLPTRAEATDVANAILDGTDAVMLSAESAMGRFPVESVAMLARIAATVEPAMARRTPDNGDPHTGRAVQLEHLVAAAVETTLARALPAAVFVPTRSGASARRVAALRLPVWTVAISPDGQACQHLQLSRGVVAVQKDDDPGEWSGFVRTWVHDHDLDGAFAVLTAGPSEANPRGNHRVELVDLRS